MIGGAKRLFLSTHPPPPPPPPAPPPTDTSTLGSHGVRCASQPGASARKSKPRRAPPPSLFCFFFPPPPLFPSPPPAGYIKLLRVRLIRDYEAVSWSCNFSGTLLLEPHTPLFDSQWNSPDPFAAAGGGPVPPTPLPNLHRAGKLLAPRSTEPNRAVIGL